MERERVSSRPIRVGAACARARPRACGRPWWADCASSSRRGAARHSMPSAMAAAPALCLLLVAATAASGQQAANAFRAAERSLPLHHPAEGSTDWPEAAAADEHESQHVMKLPATDKHHARDPHHQDDITPEEWSSASVPDVPRMVALSAARLESGSACGEDSREFLRALDNFTLWAVQMYDASVLAPSGVVFGSVYQLGHFDQCVSVRAHAGRVRGQYCLPQLDVRPLPSQPHPLPEDPYTLDFNQDQSAWLKLQYAGDRVKIRRDMEWWALCVPASCSPKQVQRALDEALRVAGPRMRLQLRAQLQDDYCTTSERPQPSCTTVIFVCVTAAVLALAVIGSCYDAHMSKKDFFMPQKKKGFGREIMECFSVQRNFRSLISTNKSIMELDIFGFIRTFSLMCIIAGHRMLHYCGFAIFDGEVEDKLFENPGSMLVANGVLFVDVFFTVGAMTVVIILFQNFNKGAKFHQLFLGILNRYVRLTPLYAVVILWHCGVMPYMGTGPFWKATVLREQERCQDSWWTNLLYVNNYVRSSHMCMFQSWYLSADFHCFLLCLFLGYVMWRWPVAGWAAMACLTVTSMALPFLTIYLQNLDPLVMPFPQVLKNFREDKVFLRLYIKSHNRAAPYLLGAMAGALVSRGQHLKWKLNEAASFAVFFVCLMAGVGLLFSAFVFFIPGRPYNALEAALFGALSHPAMAVLICIYGAIPVIFDSKRIINFLSARVFVILGRLSFAAYLIHTIPQMYDQGSLRVPRRLEAYSGVWLVIGDFCIIYPVAAVLSVLVEAPFRGLMKVLLQRIK